MYCMLIRSRPALLCQLPITEDGHFNYQDFYAQCVDYFEGEPNDEQVVELLDRWTLCVFLHCYVLISDSNYG